VGSPKVLRLIEVAARPENCNHRRITAITIIFTVTIHQNQSHMPRDQESEIKTMQEINKLGR
jgi:hypothetical protein